MTTPAVLDTNVVLDLFVFRDPAAEGLRDAVDSGRVRWIATAAMRDELARVLAYPLLQWQLGERGVQAEGVLRAFDRAALLQPPAPAAPVHCADRDDQVFVDLALAHRALLLSKDRELLRLRARLAPHGVAVAASLPRDIRPGAAAAS